jgi:hypothetical protein
MLPGFSSKNDQIGGGNGHVKKKLKLKRHSNDDGHDNNNEFNEILLQYNLERMNDQQHDFSHCDTHRDAYPFASSLSKNTDDDSLFDRVGDASSSYPDEDSDNEVNEKEEGQRQGQDGSESVEIRICTYQINTSCYIPFIEYLMVHSHEKEGKGVFEFPKFDYVSSKRKRAEKQAEEHVLKMLMQNEDAAADDANGHVVKFRGIFKPKHNFGSKLGEKKQSIVYFFFQKYFKKQKHPPQLSKRDNLWWVVSSEIANFKKVMYMDIDPFVTDLFIKNPEIMHLYDCKGRLLETPTICYFGDEFQKIKYLAFFGLLKAPVKSSFGPFYVATNFLSSMKYACYTHNQEPFELYTGEKITSGEYGKYKEGGVLRMILFIGKMKVFLRDGEPDDSQISQELAKTDKTIEKFLSLRDSNGNWTETYDTAYKGLHFASINDNVTVNPVEWFFKDYSHSAVISYHNIDTANIPGKFDVDYVDYKLK